MPNVNLEKLGETVKRLRQAKGISQEQLANLTGLHRTYIGGVERGERNIGLLNLVRIAQALEVTTSKLIEGVDYA
jgi:transcriptional regulator with XRE-family HTH domain